MSRGQSKDDEYVRDYVLDQARWSRAEHERGWCEKHIGSYEHFRNISLGITDVDDPHLQIGIGLVFPMVKTISSKLVAPWQNGDKLMDAIALEDAGVAVAPRRAAFVNNKIINEIPRSFSTTELVMESAILFGRGILKNYHRVDPPRTMLERLKVMVESYTVGVSTGWRQRGSVVKYTSDYVDPFDFWWIGGERYFERCDLCFEYQYPTESAIWRRIASKDWNDIEDDNLGSSQEDAYRAHRLEMEGSGREYGAGRPPENRLLIAQGWVETKRKANGRPVYEQRIVEILNEKYVMKNERLETYDGNPGYIVHEPVLDPGVPGSIGMVEPIEALLLTINEYVNIAMENGRMSLEAPIIADPELVQGDDVYIGRGALNWARGGKNAISFMEMKDLPPSFYQMVPMYMEMIQRITGASDQFAGMPTDQANQSGGGTARGLQLATNLAASRVTPLLKKMDLEYFRPWAYNIDGTAAQRIMTPQTVRMPMPPNPGSPFEKIHPEEFGIPLNFAFNTKALNTADTQARQAAFAQAMEMLERLAPQLPAQGAYLDVLELARLSLGQLDLEEYADKLIKSLAMPGMGMPMVAPGGPNAAVGQPPIPGRPTPPGWDPSVGLPGVDGASAALGVR